MALELNLFNTMIYDILVNKLSDYERNKYYTLMHYEKWLML